MVLGYPFSTQTISLIGYSLGCQVIKSCLQTLSRLEAHDLVHHVTLIAGATHFDKDQVLWESIFSRTISGSITNFWSQGDYILHLYQLSQRRKAIGRYPIFNGSLVNMKRETGADRPAVEEAFRYRLKNVEVPKTGHFAYRDVMGQLIRDYNIDQ